MVRASFPLVYLNVGYSEDPSVLGINKGKVVGSPERVDDSEGNCLLLVWVVMIFCFGFAPQICSASENILC